jgi:hypothetical protein
MWWSVGRECIVGDGCKFELDAVFNGQPVKLTKEVCGGTVWMAPEDNAGNRILDSLQFSQVGFRDAVEQRVAVVEARLSKGNCDCSSSVVSDGVADVTKSTAVIEGGLAN